MLQRVPNAFRAYSVVYDFIQNHVRMQFEDVGAMLRLPLHAQGVVNGCNFAAASVICNLISGISVTIFQPAVIQRPDYKGKMQTIGSGEAFKELVKAFYPEPSVAQRTAIADVLYKQLRNPFAHALGVLGKGAYQFAIQRVSSPNAATGGDGITQGELTALEESPQRPDWMPVGVQGSGNQWEIIVDFLYRDSLDLIVNLAQDVSQMKSAEGRFKGGAYVWRT